MADTFHQRFFIISRPCDMMASPEIDPLHLMHPGPECFFHRLQRRLQVIGILLTEGMEVKAVHMGQLFRTKLFPCNAQPGSGRAGIINGMIPLGGTLRIDSKPNAFLCLNRLIPEFFQLRKGVEHDVIAVCQNLIDLILPKGRGIHMVFFSHLFPAQSRLVQPAGRRPIQILPDQRIQGIHGKGFLRQQNSASGFFPDFVQLLQIPDQGIFLNEITGCSQFFFFYTDSSICFHAYSPINPPVWDSHPRSTEVPTDSAHP